MGAAGNLPLLAFLTPSPSEMLVIAIIALLLYGGDLPRVAREWGKHFTEFRRHLSGIRNELNDAIYAEPEPPRPRLQHHPEYHAAPPTPTPAVAPSVSPEPATESDSASPAVIANGSADASPAPADQPSD